MYTILKSDATIQMGATDGKRIHFTRECGVKRGGYTLLLTRLLVKPSGDNFRHFSPVYFSARTFSMD